jgi:hypothetical protein
MSKPVETVIKELELGYVPCELSYTLDKHVDIDWSALKYNEWSDLTYWMAKQPEGLLEQFPCLEGWVEQQWTENKEKTPLMEIEERQKQAEIKSEIIIYTNDSEELCTPSN